MVPESAAPATCARNGTERRKERVSIPTPRTNVARFRRTEVLPSILHAWGYESIDAATDVENIYPTEGWRTRDRGDPLKLKRDMVGSTAMRPIWESGAGGAYFRARKARSRPLVREVRMVDIRFSRPAMWLTAMTVTLAACGVGAPAPPIQVPVPSTAAEAPTGFDNRSNGAGNDSIHQADQDVFDEVEEIADGLGPLYNAQACRECHQIPTSGGASQITELRVGHLGPDGRFRNADIPIARGTVTISGRTLVNDRAICPNAAFPDSEIQERVPDTETIRTTRASLNLLGDGLVEAVADETLIEIARAQPRTTRGTIRGQALYVPILEAPGETRIGRFGWKDQHASLLSFSADAYLNEMGITSRLLPDEVTTLCNTVSEPNNTSDSSGLADIDRFTRFLRATKAPARDTLLAATPAARRGSELFDAIGCATCHVRTLVTAAAGTVLNGGTDTIPPALGEKAFHPFGDFLLHNVGTGDGIVMAMPEHYGPTVYKVLWKEFSIDSVSRTRNKMRTAPLWGVRLRPRLMHDGASLTLRDAIVRHRGEASGVSNRFRKLTQRDQEAIIAFLESL